LVLASAASAALGLSRGWAQPAGRPKVIGWLSPFTRESQTAAIDIFKAQLKALGALEGRDYVLEGRWSGGSVDTLPALATELLALEAAVIVTAGSAAVTVLKRATRTVPIVFLSAGDPVESGFVESLARPGGNITGVMLRDLHSKVLELIREVLPAVRRVAFLEHRSDPISTRLSAMLEKGAAALRYESFVAPVARIEDLDRALAAAVKGKADAVLAPQYSLFVLHAQRIGELAAKMRLPLFATWRRFADAGGLLSYYANLGDSTRHGAMLVNKILRGASPAELPVEQPDRFSLAINMRTARALRIRIPQSILLRADRVIE
jgi:putative ABC transport system substrate-binding protein